MSDTETVPPTFEVRFARPEGSMTIHLPPLTDEQRARLKDHEAFIDRVLDDSIGLWLRIQEIRDEQLFRETHATFAAYCQDRFDLTGRRANQMIAYAGLVQSLTDERAADATHQAAPAVNGKAATNGHAATNGEAAKPVKPAAKADVPKEWTLRPLTTSGIPPEHHKEVVKAAELIRDQAGAAAMTQGHVQAAVAAWYEAQRPEEQSAFEAKAKVEPEPEPDPPAPVKVKSDDELTNAEWFEKYLDPLRNKLAPPQQKLLRRDSLAWRAYTATEAHRQSAQNLTRTLKVGGEGPRGRFTASLIRMYRQLAVHPSRWRACRSCNGMQDPKQGACKDCGSCGYHIGE